MHLLEEGSIDVLLGKHAIHHALQQRVELIALQVVVITPAHGGPGQLIEQAPRRVGGAVEETLVGDGHPQNRQLHAADQRLERGRQLAVPQHHVEQHGHQVDDVIIDPIKLAYLAGLTLLLLQLPADMPAQVRQRGSLCRLAAEMIEHAEQLVAAYRGRGRCAQRTEGNVATGMAPAADQLAEQRQHLLIGLTTSRGRWHGTAGR